MPICSHKDGCSRPGVHEVDIGNDQYALVCDDHYAKLQADLENMELLLAMLGPPRCPRCDEVMAGGLFGHTCGEPGPTHPEL